MAKITDDEVEDLKSVLAGYADRDLDLFFRSTTKEELRERLGSTAHIMSPEQMTLIYRIGPKWRMYFYGEEYRPSDDDDATYD